MRSFISRTLFTNLIIATFGLANSVLLSRWLGPAGRGEVAAAMLWPVLLVYLSSFGLIQSCMYFSALPNSEPQKVWGNASLMGVIQSVIAVCIGFFLMPLLLKSQTSDVIYASRMFLIMIPLGILTQYGVSILQGRLQIRLFNLMRVIIPVGYLTGTLTFFLTGQLTVINIIFLHIFLNAISLFAILFSIVKIGLGLKLQTDVPLAKSMLKYGLKVNLGNITGLANLSMDQVLMAAFLAPVNLGIYVVAVSSATVLQMLPQSVQMVLSPSIAQRESSEERIDILKRVFRYYWMISLLACLGLAPIIYLGVPVVFGAGFKDATLPAEILLLGIFFVGAKEVLSNGAQALGDPMLGSKAQLIGFFVTVVLLCVLLPTMGIIGAAITTTAGYMVQFAVVVLGLSRNHHISASELFRFSLKDVSESLSMLGFNKRPKQFSESIERINS